MFEPRRFCEGEKIVKSSGSGVSTKARPVQILLVLTCQAASPVEFKVADRHRPCLSFFHTRFIIIWTFIHTVVDEKRQTTRLRKHDEDTNNVLWLIEYGARPRYT